MTLAIIILSVTVLLLILLLIFCAFMLIDVRARCDMALDLLRDKENVMHRAQSIVLDKFDYYIPFSDSHLSLEEERLRQSAKDGGK